MAGKKRVPARVKAKKEFKPQGFTKKEWITMGIVVAAIALVIVGYFLLKDFFDGSLRISGGTVQAEDNWIVVNTGTTDKPKYFKLGTVSPVDGYTMTTEHYTGDDNVPTFFYYPEGESTVESVSLLAAKGKAEEMADKVSANYGSYLQNAVSSEVSQLTVGGHTGWGFSCDYEDPQTDESAEAEATPAPDGMEAATPVKAARVISVYFDASHEMSVLASITAKADDASQLPDIEAMYKLLDPFVQGMTIDGEVLSTAAPTAAADVEAASDAVVTAAPTEEPTATPTIAPTATPTIAPTATPTIAPTATPTIAPTATPTIAPTAMPTVAPTATPTIAPTATPTVAPTATPTIAPTATAAA